jgi:hypothetical protein
MRWWICGTCGGRGFVEVLTPTTTGYGTTTQTCPQCKGAGGSMGEDWDMPTSLVDPIGHRAWLVAHELLASELDFALADLDQRQQGSK